MIPLGQSVLTLILAVSAGGGYAQALQDPMRPPGFAFPSGAGPGAMAPSGPVLQSTLVSNGRRIAMIDGKPMKIGDKIGGARIVAIAPASVTLREGRKTRVLELFHGVKLTQPAPPRKPASADKGKLKGT